MDATAKNTIHLASPLVYESAATVIYRVPYEKAVGEGRTGAVAAKKLNVDAAGASKISCLYDEYILSKYLSNKGCAAVRGAIKYEKGNGFHTSYLEWVCGVTLSQWIRSARVPETSSSLNRTVRLAWEITRAVSELHRTGVVHNNICAENIIVHEAEAKPGTFTVKIIDLGSASLMEKSCSQQLSGVNVERRDLKSLGELFYEMFSGMKVDNESKSNDSSEEYFNSTRKRAKNATKRPIPPLHRLKLTNGKMEDPIPLSISSLVSNLMEASGSVNIRYESAKDVEGDLYLMLVDSDRFLFDQSLNEMPGRLQLPPGKLYGRAKETSTLMDAFNRMIARDEKSEIVLVHGFSGTGKSALVQHIRQPVIETGGFFLSGKFDQLGKLEPMSAIIEAFRDYCDQVVEAGAEVIEKTRASINRSVGSDCAFLMDLVPDLRKIVGVEMGTSLCVKIGDRQRKNRFRFVFRTFVRAIATLSHPVVLFLDDLQWADDSSLDLIRTLVTDTRSNSFLFIGAYRDNEVSDVHPLSITIRDIRKKNVVTTRIKVENLSRECCNELTSDALHMTRRLTLPLSEIVHEKTSGNAFFVVQFLKALFDRGFLRYRADSRAWEWDRATIRSMVTADDALKLLVDKIRNLPDDVQISLKVAACLGSHCENSILRLILTKDSAARSANNAIKGEDDAMARRLETAVTHGFMEKVGSKFRFSHDEVQRAVYSQIPARERSELHHAIGNCIWKNAPVANIDHVLFAVVDQLNRGVAFITDEQEKIKLSGLNLRAGDKCTSSSAFLLASTYFRKGIELLGPGHWEKEYNLSLQLYNASSETDFCIGDFDVMRQALGEIFSHAQNFRDKLRAYYTLVCALGAQSKVQEAMDTALLVLEKLGEPFPDVADDNRSAFPTLIMTMVTNQMIITRDMLDAYTDDMLVNLKQMEDSTKIAAMRFLNSLIRYTYVAKQELFPLVAFRMLQLTLVYGVCMESVFGFACYGVLSCGAFDDVKTGYRFGKVALALLERFDDKSCLTRVLMAMYASISPWMHHVRRSLEPFLHAYRVGMRSGDIEYALMSAHYHCAYSFQSGQQLKDVEESMRTFCHQMVEYKQDMLLIKTLLFRQAVLNLMGHSRDPLQLTGEAMAEEQMTNNVLTRNDSSSLMYFLRMWLAYLYGDYKLAAEMSEKSRDLSKTHLSRFEICNHTFCDGLISLAFACKTNDMKWNILADKAIEKMRKWAAHAPCNCRHKLALLEAEHAVSRDEYDKAVELYESAIMLAGKYKFVQDRALAHERAGIFYLYIGNEAKASHNFNHAHTAYLEWGARGKAEHVRCRHLSILMLESP